VFRSNEMISGMLLTWHNLQYFQDIMDGMRHAIAAGRFTQWQSDFHSGRAMGDIEPL
jgi:queuine tRNA-ribosyltransferase